MTLPGSALTIFDLERLARSGISAELAQQPLLRRVTSVEGAAVIGRNGSGDYAGILFPYVRPGQDYVLGYRLRRDHPEIEYRSDGTPKEVGKYMAAPGDANRLYFPPGTSAGGSPIQACRW